MNTRFQKLITQNTEEKSHFEDLEDSKKCNHPEHKPPTHLFIPQGKKYIHICPGCKNRIELTPLQIK